jgi:hypothetical protein
VRRFTLGSTRKELADFFGVLFPDLPPRYNLAPTQEVPAIRAAGVGRVGTFKIQLRSAVAVLRLAIGLVAAVAGVLAARGVPAEAPAPTHAGNRPPTRRSWAPWGSSPNP